MLVTPARIAISFGPHIEKIVVTRGREIDQRHAGLHPILEAQVFVQVFGGPKIDHPDRSVTTADAVDSSEALDQSHRVPVDVYVHQQIGVLQILTLRDTVRGDEQIDFTAGLGPSH